MAQGTLAAAAAPSAWLPCPADVLIYVTPYMILICVSVVAENSRASPAAAAGVTATTTTSTRTSSIPRAAANEPTPQSHTIAELHPRSIRLRLRGIQVSKTENPNGNIAPSHSSSLSLSNSSHPTPDRSETPGWSTQPTLHIRNSRDLEPNAKPSMTTNLASPSPSLSPRPPIIYDTIEVMPEPPPDYFSVKTRTGNKRKGFRPGIRRSKRRRVGTPEDRTSLDLEDTLSVEKGPTIDKLLEDAIKETTKSEEPGQLHISMVAAPEVTMKDGEPDGQAGASEIIHDNELDWRIPHPDSGPDACEEAEDATSRTVNEPPITVPTPAPGESITQPRSNLHELSMLVPPSTPSEPVPGDLASLHEPEPVTFPLLRTLKHVLIPTTPEPDDVPDDEESWDLSVTKSHQSEDINDWLMTDVEQSMEEEGREQPDGGPKEENLEKELEQNGNRNEEKMKREMQLESRPQSPRPCDPESIAANICPQDEVQEELEMVNGATASEGPSIELKDLSIAPEQVLVASEVVTLETEENNEMALDSDLESQNEILPHSHTRAEPIAALIDEARTGVVLESPSPPLRTVMPRRIAPRPILHASLTGPSPSILNQSDMAHSAITTRDSSHTPMNDSNRSSVPLHETTDSARSSASPFQRTTLPDNGLRRSTRRVFEPLSDFPRRIHISLDVTSINDSTTPPSLSSPESLPTPPVASPSPPSRVVSPSFGLRTTPRPIIRPPVRPTRGGLRYINHDRDPRSKLLMARPKIAIPSHIPLSDYARECLDAAVFCRLPPYSLDPAEHKLFRTHINHVQVTTYLNIRNGILRMWTLNPTIAVCREEALGVAKEDRHLQMAAKCHEFLVRHGYINFGCIRPPRPLSRPLGVPLQKSSRSRKRVIVIGAGAAGLGCARQLESLFVQFADRFPRNEDLPEVIILEGRNRVGGRIYSHPLTPPIVPERLVSSSMFNSKSSTLSSVSSVSGISSSSPAQACLQRLPDPAVDLGAQIVTGFENGNPLAPVIKRQLQLRWHHLHDDSLLFNDQDGVRVDATEDQRAEKLFNNILDRASAFKEKIKDSYLIEGDRELMDQGKEPHGESGRQIAKVEENEAVLPPMPPSPPLSATPGSPGSSHSSPPPAGRKHRIPARRTLTKMGFNLKYAEETARKTRADRTVTNNTLGEAMKTILGDIQELVDLNPMDMKLLNWHWANLEYGNATNLNNLSLKNWDQDDGNEFLGAHAMILGGYGQFTNGLASFPTKLNIRYNHRVRTIKYGKLQRSALSDPDESPVTVICDDGNSIEADTVIVTASLGVLKSAMIQFDPELPAEKTAAISRLGFGLLNKVVLVYDTPFWDIDADFIGCLRTPDSGDHRCQDSYESVRGRFYLIWNCTASCGRPTLVALMAGEAAHQVEAENDGKLVAEMTSILARIHHKQTLPPPTQYLVTRWNSDIYARGSYSYVGAESSGKDYDVLGQPVDHKIFFAGEATCRTHPATVHGAYMSGLRAAAEVLESFIGKIDLPSGDVLIPKKHHPFRNPLVEESSIPRVRKRTDPESNRHKARNVRRHRFSKIAEECSTRILAQVGPKPIPPKKYLPNAFLLFQKDKWEEAREKANRAKSLASPEAPDLASRDEIRASMGKMWKNLPDGEKKRYNDAIEKDKAQYREEMSTFDSRVEAWERAAEKIKDEMKAKLDEIELSEEEKILFRAAEEEERLETLAREEREKLRKFYEDAGIDDLLPDEDDENSEDLYLESDDAVLDHLLRRSV